MFIQPLGTARQEILGVLEEYYPEALSVKALAEELPEIGNANLRKTLKRMAEDGQIKKSARGEYCAFSAPSPSPQQEGLSQEEHWSQASQASQASQRIRAEEGLPQEEHWSQASQASQLVRAE